MLQWFKRYPVFYAVLVVCGFFLWVLPQWLGDVWPLFSDKKIPEWLAEKQWPSISPTLFMWFTATISVAVLSLLGVIIYQQRTKKEQLPVINTGKEPIPPLFSLTALQAKKLTTDIKSVMHLLNAGVQIKIASTQEHMGFAKQLANALRTAGCYLLTDEERNESVSLARSAHNKIVLRFRFDGPTQHSLVCLFLAEVFSQMFRSQIEINKFPQESTPYYFQIEIGGAP